MTTLPQLSPQNLLSLIGYKQVVIEYLEARVEEMGQIVQSLQPRPANVLDFPDHADMSVDELPPTI